MDKNNSVSTQGYAAALQHPSNLDSGKTKSKVKSGPQQKNKGASSKPNPLAKVNTPISSLAPVSTLVSNPGTLILSVNHEATLAPRDGAEQKDPEEWIQVRRKSERASLPGVLHGSAAPGVTKLRASERWRYLHLYYVQEGTTVEEVRAHLHSISGNNDCIMEELKLRGK